MPIFGAIDLPADTEAVAREGFLAVGFAYDTAAGPFSRVVVKHEGVEIGATSIHHSRPDLTQAIPAVSNLACGFRVTATLPPSANSGKSSIDVSAHFESGTTWSASRRIVVPAQDYRQSPYGSLLHSDIAHVYSRKDIYSVGPPSDTASAECVALLKSYLAAGESVIDIGCGLGPYGPPLIASGVDWHGCEANAAFVDQLCERGLPVSLVAGDVLPFPTGAFVSAMCIEVLEHVVDYDAFLIEIGRVARNRAFFSVPNVEAIPVLADRLVVPWHLLEADHKSFFTRAGLRAALERHFRHVEVIPYGVMPLQSSNGTPVFYHLFAVAEH